MVELCSHWHTREHITYVEGYDDEYAYTLKTNMNVCVTCLQIHRTWTRRVVYLVLSKQSTDILKTYNFKKDAETYAKVVNGKWVEAEIAGALGDNG
jgi:hypothetical protein